MWNKLTKLAQNPNTLRLVLALIISIALHALLFGGFDYSLPSFKKEMHVIEARIQMPKVIKKIEIPELKEIVEAKKTSEKVPEKPPAKPLVEQTPLPTDMPAETPIEAPQPDLPISQPENPSPEAQQPENLEATPQPEDIGLVINENAYQYIETEFDVRTKIDGSAEGKAKITFSIMDGDKYQLKSLMEPRGLAALFIGDLLQTSAGALTKKGLQPNSYLYQFGNKADKTYTANFDWQNKKLNLITEKGTKTADLPDDAQDLLSFMYQFMYVAPLQTMNINITNGKKIANYDYHFDGEENINSDLGEIKTMHISHSAVETDDKVDLWLAVDYQYVPVKIRKLDKNGKVYEMVATRISTNRPTINK